MLRQVLLLYPSTRLICVGFSMGANLTTKLMGSIDESLRSKIVGAQSVCQPYDARK
jgi:abhydrolase domain-containing protein 2